VSTTFKNLLILEERSKMPSEICQTMSLLSWNPGEKLMLDESKLFSELGGRDLVEAVWINMGRL
jgi:hypothetical protein